MTDKQIIEQQRKEIKFLHKQLKDKDEVIEDLSKGHYKEKCLSLEVENAEIKKIKNVRRKISDIKKSN